MPLRKFKPTSPGRRFMTISGFEEITTDEPEKTLLESLPTHAGRNNQGRITTRHQGGGYRKLYRKIDFKRDKHGVAGRVATIEYDPNRSARIALIHYKDGEKRYILAPLGLKVGDPIESGEEAPVRIGNAIPLANIPVGSTIHNIELTLGRRRPARPLRGHVRAAAGEGRRLRSRAHAIRRAAPNPRPLPGHDRPSR